ncbi:hypothetical protein C8N47_107203 [Mangrovibacterium marinum]|uniref:Uncharacterized protein n=1 Tax=Mangrovibacterium marinum TaxID=1639118 RepID=A0A2T5C2G3_9BACT|nr:hypothetical protein C8N47_107203 [Mangrovibacterium marinum]
MLIVGRYEQQLESKKAGLAIMLLFEDIRKNLLLFDID